MNSLLDPPKSSKTEHAANDDHVGEHIVVTPVSGAGQGWDAFDVWRRLVKDARDRREGRVPGHS
jgi:hypothetical protein